MMPLPQRHLTSLLLRREGDIYLFDAGEGTQVALRRLNLRWKKIAAIFISHTHADHVTGLPGLLMLSSQVDRDEPLYIYGPPRIVDYIEGNRRVLDMYINYELVVREIAAPCVCHQGEGFQVRAFPLRHTKTCVGYTFEEERRPGAFHPEQAKALGVPMGPLWSRLQAGETIKLADGREIRPDQVLGPSRSSRKVGFITDTAYFPEMATEVGGCDLLVCEGMFERALAADALEKRHMTAEQAAMVARDAGGVKRLALIHFSPRYTDHDLRQLQEEAAAIFPATILARDRMSIPLEYED